MHWRAIVAKARGWRAAEHTSRVAIDMGLVEGAEISVALEAQGWRIVVTGGPVHHSQLVFGRLRNGVDAVPTVLQLLNRGVCPRAELAVTRSELQVRLKPIRLVADIAVKIGDLRISIDAPPTVVGLPRRHRNSGISNPPCVTNPLLSAIE